MRQAMYFNTVTYRGVEWNYVYLDGPGLAIPVEDHRKVIEVAIEIHVEKKTSANVIGKSIEGKVYTHREQVSLGSFHGQRYYCDYEGENGKGTISIIARDSNINPTTLFQPNSRN